MPRAAAVDGSHILYHYLQKNLLTEDIWLFQMLLARLVTSQGSGFRRSPIQRCR